MIANRIMPRRLPYPMVWGVLVAGVILGIGVVVWKNGTPSTSPTAGSEVTAGTALCSTDRLRVCVTAPPGHLTAHDSVDAIITIKNTGDTQYSTVFSTTCTDPTLEIDTKPVLSHVICGQSVTQITIAPGETRTYYQRIVGSQLTSGAHRLRYLWASGATPQFDVVRD